MQAFWYADADTPEAMLRMFIFGITAAESLAMFGILLCSAAATNETLTQCILILLPIFVLAGIEFLICVNKKKSF